jgi:hypothetical protein
MSKLRTTAIALALATSVTMVGLSSQHASALTSGNQNSGVSCDVKTAGYITGAGDATHRYTLNSDGTVTARFKVIGENCKAEVTLVGFTAPNGTDGKPYSAQKVFSHVTGTFKPGEHTLTTTLPTCFYQVDLIVGHNYDVYPAHTFTELGTLRSSLHGGTQSCTPTPPVTPPTTPTVTPTALANTGASAGAIVAIVLSTVVASTVAFRTYLSRKNA